MTSSWVKKNLGSIKNHYLTATQIKLMSESIKCRWTLRGAKTHVRSRASVGEKRIYFYFEDMWRVFLRTTGKTFDCLPYECWIGSIESENPLSIVMRSFSSSICFFLPFLDKKTKFIEEKDFLQEFSLLSNFYLSIFHSNFPSYTWHWRFTFPFWLLRNEFCVINFSASAISRRLNAWRIIKV